MKRIEWVKLDTGFFEDEKIVLLLSEYGEKTVLFFLRLLTLAGKQNQGGRISFSENIPYSAKNLGKICQISAKKCESFLNILEKFQIIFRNNGLIFLTNWEKHQSQDKLEKIRQQHVERAKRYRENQKKSNVTVTSPLRHSNATDLDSDLDLDLEDLDLEDLKDLGQVEKSNLPNSNLKSSPINQEIFDPLDGKKEKKAEGKHAENSEAYILAKTLFENIREMNPGHKIPDLQKWCEETDKMLRIDKRDFREAMEVLEYLKTDEFWKKNILSTAKLRAHYDQLKIKKDGKSKNYTKPSKFTNSKVVKL
jgi:predicted phage replisome organizer